MQQACVSSARCPCTQGISARAAANCFLFQWVDTSQGLESRLLSWKRLLLAQWAGGQLAVAEDGGGGPRTPVPKPCPHTHLHTSAKADWGHSPIPGQFGPRSWPGLVAAGLYMC